MIDDEGNILEDEEEAPTLFDPVCRAKFLKQEEDQDFDPVRDIRWVYNALGVSGLKQSDAPSTGAWRLLHEAEDDLAVLKAFYAGPLAKLLATEVKKEKEIREIEKIEEKVDQVVEEAKKAVNGAVKASLGQIEEEWGQLLSNLSPKYRSIAGLLRSARPKQMEGRYLTVEVFYKFHKDQLEQESKRKVVEEVANKLWGPVALKCVLGEKPGLVVETVAVSEVENKAEEEIVKAAEDIFG